MVPTSTSTAVLVYDVSDADPQWPSLDGFVSARVLCLAHGQPLGWVPVPIEDGRLDIRTLVRELVEQHAHALATALAEDLLQRHAGGRAPSRLDVDAWLRTLPTRRDGPLVTVAVCTRNRPDDLRQCLAALQELQYTRVDLLVVDNAPSDDRTEQLVRREFPAVRYVREDRPGLDWARNRAIAECRGDILAYTDDDVIVDARWVSALVDTFAADSQVMAVTGLVIPHELETSAQRLFETYGGFGRGFARRWYRADTAQPVAPVHAGAGKFGTGANMAFRRTIFDRIGPFDPALDVGTCTNGGGDLEMFFRILKHGHTLVYEPAAIVRHRHRRTYAQLRTQIANNGVGFYSYLVRTARAYPDERRGVLRFGLWWFYWWSLRRLWRALLRKEAVGIDLVRAELVGSIRGLRRYQRALRAVGHDQLPPAEPVTDEATPGRIPEAIRCVNLEQPLAPITDTAEYQRVRLIVSWDDRPVGSALVEHHGALINTTWLRDSISQQLSWGVLDAGMGLGRCVQYAQVVCGVAQTLSERHRSETARPATTELAAGAPVSVVIATYDRPDMLRRCLASIVAQRTTRPVQIVVVDNHPASGVTRDVVEEFPRVQLVEEERPGLSYARNRGIAAATGDIIICTDDDVTCPPDWVERLLVPFRQRDVMVVTGNVLPASLETEAERLFEKYGGLGRGFTPFKVDREWFARGRRAVPTWWLGCTANAAFRARIFRSPDIGLMDEALGAGSPTGCSEDTYVFYRVLQAGFAISYEPRAYVWHHHRATLEALRRQIYSYSKGHVAYHLTTWLRDGDFRGLVRVLFELPVTHTRRAVDRLRGASDYPMSLLVLEVLGNLAGPVALWRARRRVRRLGTSGAIIDRAVDARLSSAPAEAEN